MKFSDWVPIIVALVTFIGVVTVPSLGGNRPRQQLEALKAVREAIQATDDEDVRGNLRQAERDLAVRIESRYKPWSRKTTWIYWIVFVATAVVLGGVVTMTIISVVNAPPGSGSNAGSDGAVIVATFTVAVTTGVAMLVGLRSGGPFAKLLRPRKGKRKRKRKW
ncbi:MAG: hypothetical protein AAGC66_04490 [Leifsonia sp.]